MKKFLITTTLFLSMTSSVFAAGNEFLIQIKDHKFFPPILEIEAEKKFVLIVENLDQTLEEFESHDLRKEKMIRPGKKVRIPVGALKAGEYEFVGEFHEDTAKGKIIVK
jgi:hypothetical protein